MSDATDRPQDSGRRHRASLGAPSAPTVEVLERYRGAMREELGDVLRELRPALAQLTLGVDGAQPELVPLRPALQDRLKLWDLAIKLGRELASPGLAGLEEEPAPPDASNPARPRAARAPRLSARERRSLGG